MGAAARPPASGPGGSELPPLPGGAGCPLRRQAGRALPSAARRGGPGASSPSAPAPPPPAVPPGAALTGRAAPGGAEGPQDGGGSGESRLALGDGIWLGKRQTEPLVVALRAPGWRLLVSER